MRQTVDGVKNNISVGFSLDIREGRQSNVPQLIFMLSLRFDTAKPLETNSVESLLRIFHLL